MIKRITTKKGILFGISLTICVILGLTQPFSISKENNKTVIHQPTTYLYFKPTDLADQSKYVVRGMVVKKGKTKTVQIPLTTEIDIDKSNEGKYLEHVETEVTIEVNDSVKNRSASKFVTYMEEGGELENLIVEPEGGRLQIGDEVLIFLNDNGYSWGSQGVLKIDDGNINMDELIAKLKEHVPAEERPSE